MQTNIPLRPFQKGLLSSLLLLLLFNSCQKEESFDLDSKIQPRASLLGESRLYFNQQIQGQRLQAMPNNPRHRVSKTPVWDQAQAVQLSVGAGFKVPLRYQGSISLVIGQNKQAVPLAQLSYLLVYKDQQGRYRYEVVTQIPDADYWAHRHEAGRSFSGIIIVEDWWGRPIKTFRKVNKGHYTFLANPVLKTKPGGKNQNDPQNMMEAEEDCDVIVTENEQRMYEVEFICDEIDGGGGNSGGGGFGGPGGGGWGNPGGLGGGGGFGDGGYGGGGQGGPQPPDYEERPRGGGGGGRRNDDPPANEALDTTMSANFYQNQKARCALAKLMQNNYYKTTLNNFIGENKTIDLNFKIEPIADPLVYGRTELQSNNWNTKNIYLILNQNTIPNIPSIEVALTLLHEGIHAEIFRKIISIQGPSNLNIDNFPSLFNMYAQYKGYQHEFIANFYLDIMSRALQQFDNYKFSMEYYQALAWRGLEGTEVYNGLNAAKKEDIRLKRITLLANRNNSNCNDQSVE